MLLVNTPPESPESRDTGPEKETGAVTVLDSPGNDIYLLEIM